MKQSSPQNRKTLNLAKVFCVVTLLAVMSCARTADVYDTPKETSQESKTKQEMSLEDKTIRLFSSLYNTSLRNGVTPTLSSLDSTNTESPDTKLYLANFSEGGFMLFRDGGGEEMEVIGHSDESSLHFSDGEANPILGQIFHTSASLYAGHTGLPTPKPSPFPDPNPNPNPNPYPGGTPPALQDYPKTIIESRSEPYIVKDFNPNTYQYFGQGRPFNCYISSSFIMSEDIDAGCGSIAIATLLSHYEMQAGGSNVDWKRLKQYYNKPLNRNPKLEDDKELIHQLRVLVKDTWKYAGSISTTGFTMSFPSKVSKYLKRAGFNVDYVKNYKPGEICQILRDKHQPFILLGWSQDDDGKKGHYWVVDGLARRVHKEYGYTIESPGATPEPFESEVSDNYYFHCTWGWNGGSNGWFAPRVINDNEGIPDDELRSSHPKGEYYNISTFYIWK